MRIFSAMASPSESWSSESQFVCRGFTRQREVRLY